MEAEAVIDVIHTILDVISGRRNLAAHEADALHEALTPGYTTEAPSAQEVAQAEALLARAGLAASPAPVSAPVASSGATDSVSEGA